jgi:Ca2+-binding EF-hand superfamily protein
MNYLQQTQGQSQQSANVFSTDQIPPSGWPPGYGPSSASGTQPPPSPMSSYATTTPQVGGYTTPQPSTGTTYGPTNTPNNYYDITSRLATETPSMAVPSYAAATLTTPQPPPQPQPQPQYSAPTPTSSYLSTAQYPTSSVPTPQQYAAPPPSAVIAPTSPPTVPMATASAVNVPSVPLTYAAPIEEGIPVAQSLGPSGSGYVQEGRQINYDRDREWLRQYGSAAPDEMFLLREWFASVDQQRTGEINATELQTALSAGGEKFNDEICKMLIQMFDADRNRSVNFLEFAHLYKFIRSMRESFDKCDIHRTGFLNVTQLTQALTLAGFVGIPPSVVQCFFKKFDRNRRGKLSFENFMELCVVLGFTRIWFRARDIDNDGKIVITINELLDIISIT